MARPKKKGLDYFPKDVNFYSDRKVRRLLSKHGLNSLLVFDYLLCLIYSENGYFINHDEDITFDIKDGLNNLVSEEFVKLVLNSCFDVGLLSYEMDKEYNILTSKGIQNRYLQAKRRGSVDQKYMLVELKDKEEPQQKSSSEQQPSRPDVPPHQKDSYKYAGANTDNLRAFAFAQQQKPRKFSEQFQMKHWRYIKDKKRFIEYFNNIVDEKQIDYNPDVLIPRLCRLATTWVENQKKFDNEKQANTKQTSNIPTNE